MKKRFITFLTLFATIKASMFAQSWIIYNTGNSSLPDNFITAIEQDAMGNYWVGSYNNPK